MNLGSGRVGLNGPSTPDGWIAATFGRAGRLVGGSAFPHDAQGGTDGEIPFYKVSDLGRSIDSKHMGDGQHRISAAVAHRLRATIVPSGAVLWAKIGAALRLNKRRITSERACVDNNMTAYIPHPHMATTEWAFYWTSAVDFGVFATPGAVPSFSEGSQARVPFWLPPLDEQRRIAAFLDHETARIDELVQEQETLQRHVKRRRMAAIDATLWGESPLPEWDLGSSSTSRTVQREGWRRLRLKHVVDHLTVGVVVEPTQYVAADGLPYIYGADIKDGAIHWEHARRIDPEVSRTLKKSLLRTGDVLVVRVGDPGQCAVVPPECEGGNCASVVHIRTSPGVLPEWLALAIRAARTQAQIDLVVYGAAQRQFNVAHALEFWLDVPPLAVQQRAVEAVRVADEGMRVLDEAVALSTLLLRERRSALITAAVTGQIDVRSWTPPDDWLSTETT